MKSHRLKTKLQRMGKNKFNKLETQNPVVVFFECFKIMLIPVLIYYIFSYFSRYLSDTPNFPLTMRKNKLQQGLWCFVF